jgi:hypothetical protein
MIYRALLGFASYNVIDLLPSSANRFQKNLNEPFTLGRQFDVSINNGTTKHMFNQANCCKAIHDHTRPAGIMIHWTPCLGWVNHGIFDVQPGFCCDLASRNQYRTIFSCLATAEGLFDLNLSEVNLATGRRRIE